MINVEGKSILVTGADSMIGSAVCDKLVEQDAIVLGLTHRDVDLLCPTQTHLSFKWSNPDYIIHLATYSGNGQFNQKYPYDTFWRTTQIALNVFEAARKINAKKILSVISSCAIADKGNKELTEIELHDGLPNQSIESHGFAKRNLHALSRQIFKQFQIPSVCCIVNNSFGERDSFSLDKTKVVAALIKKFVDAKEQNLESVVNWGTGIAKRELIYAKDAADLIIMALSKYSDSLVPINIGSPFEYSINELSQIIKEIVGFQGHIIWDHSYGDGQLRKKLDLTKMNRELLDNKEYKYTDMKTALTNTVTWYRNNKNTWTK